MRFRQLPRSHLPRGTKEKPLRIGRLVLSSFREGIFAGLMDLVRTDDYFLLLSFDDSSMVAVVMYPGGQANRGRALPQAPEASVHTGVTLVNWVLRLRGRSESRLADRSAPVPVRLRELTREPEFWFLSDYGRGRRIVTPAILSVVKVDLAVVGLATRQVVSAVMEPTRGLRAALQNVDRRGKTAGVGKVRYHNQVAFRIGLCGRVELATSCVAGKPPAAPANLVLDGRARDGSAIVHEGLDLPVHESGCADA